MSTINHLSLDTRAPFTGLVHHPQDHDSFFLLFSLPRDHYMGIPFTHSTFIHRLCYPCTFPAFQNLRRLLHFITTCALVPHYLLTCIHACPHTHTHTLTLPSIQHILRHLVLAFSFRGQPRKPATTDTPSPATIPSTCLCKIISSPARLQGQ